MIDTTAPKPLVPVPHALLRPPDEAAAGRQVRRRVRRSAARRVVLGALVVLSWVVGGYALYLVGTGFTAIPDGPGDNGLPLALRVHVAAAAVPLLLWPLQTARTLRRRLPALHRWSGRTYALGVVVGGVSGAVAAVGTTAGPLAGAGFLLLGLVWTGCTVVAVLRVRGGDVAAHRRWMVRSVALTLAAATLRLQLGTATALGADLDVVYPAVAWLCWVPNLVLAEWWLARRPGPLRAVSPRGAGRSAGR